MNNREEDIESLYYNSSFLGFVNFYHKFIPNYSNIVTPIVLLTCKDHP